MRRKPKSHSGDGINGKPAVLMIAYTYYKSDARVVREAEAALNAGCDVDFLALRRPGDPPVEDIRGVRVFNLAQTRYRGGTRHSYISAYIRFFLRCFLKANSLHFVRWYRIIHVHNMPDFMVFSTLIAKLLGAKVILDIHDPMPNTFSSKFRLSDEGLAYRVLLWQELLSARYSDRVLTVHDPVKEGILAKHGLSKSIHVIANFPDLNLFTRCSGYDLNGQIRLVYHGTIHRRSGLGNVILAVASIRHRRTIRVKIIGEGDFSGELKDLIARHGVADIVEFDNHSYPVHEIPRRIADCNVGLVPLEISSLTNYALPVKLAEYIAMELPVITVRSAAIEHYFTEQDCMFYDWDNVESLRSLLDGLAERPQDLLRYHQRAVVLRDTFSWSAERDKYVSLLKDLLSTAA